MAPAQADKATQATDIDQEVLEARIEQLPDGVVLKILVHHKDAFDNSVVARAQELANEIHYLNVGLERMWEEWRDFTSASNNEAYLRMVAIDSNEAAWIKVHIPTAASAVKRRMRTIVARYKEVAARFDDYEATLRRIGPDIKPVIFNAPVPSRIENGAAAGDLFIAKMSPDVHWDSETPSWVHYHFSGWEDDEGTDDDYSERAFARVTGHLREWATQVVLYD